MNSKNSMKDPAVELRALGWLKFQLVALVAVPLILGGLFFCVGYFAEVTWVYFLASAMGLVALSSHGKQEEYRHRIAEKERLVAEMNSQ